MREMELKTRSIHNSFNELFCKGCEKKHGKWEGNWINKSLLLLF